MKNIITFLLISVLCVPLACAQENPEIDKNAIEYANSITEEDLKGHLSILASDAFEGRETGKRGQKLAATYISNHYKEINLAAPVETNCDASYYQNVELNYFLHDESYVKVGDDKFEIGKQIYYKGSPFNSSTVNTEVVFGGTGSKEELEAIDFLGKSVLIYNENRRQRDAALTYINDNGGKMLFAITKSNQEDFLESVELLSKSLKEPKIGLANLSEKDQKGIFYLGPDVIKEMYNISFNEIVEKIEKAKKSSLKKLSKFDQVTFEYQLDYEFTSLSSENVLGYLEGSDLKDELLVITAHYDHEGVKNGEIYNGADDDASGTSAVLEIAEAFALAKANGHGPRRSILFMAVTGEERGLLGSKYYTQNPVFPLENTVTNLNIDMVGRRGYGKEDNGNYVYVIGADKLSTDLHNINENANTLYLQLELDYTYNDENDKNRFYYRSDHYNFAKRGIPIIFYFNGTHIDYHKPTDTVEKIEFDLLAKRTQLVFYTAWEVANRDQRLVVDKEIK